MTQLYTRIFFPTYILNHIAKCVFAFRQFVDRTAIVAPKRLLFVAFALMGAVAAGFAQDGAIKNLAGAWMVQSATVLENGREIDSVAYTLVFFGDHITKGIPLKITGDGSVTYSRGGQPMNATIKINEGNLVFYFPQRRTASKISDKGEVSTSGNQFTTTTYQYSAQRKELVITREDPEFSERYAFKRQ